MSDDYLWATLDLADESESTTARVNGWLDAIMRGFHQSRPNDEVRTKWLQAQRVDGAVQRGVWDEGSLPLARNVPVATFGHFVKTLNAGVSTIPVWMITDVTVAATHRRRGLMRRLMTENLEAAVAHRMPVAVLTSSEGAIYQRFGFGPATREARVRVDTSPRFAFRDRPDDGGRVVMVDSAQAWPLLSRVFERHHAVTRGSVGRPNYYESALTGFDWDEQSEDLKQRLAVRLGPDGEPDGFVSYVMRHGDEPHVEVRDMVAATPVAHLALWQFLSDIDLSDIVIGPAPVVDHLGHALVDHRVRRVTSVPDHLWVRVLDLRAALEARPWFADDALTLSVVDPLGHADGTVRIDAAAGTATVAPAAPSESPDITLDIDTLGSLYLGDVTLDPLVKAGRIKGSERALRRFAALVDGGPAPHCNTHF